MRFFIALEVPEENKQQLIEIQHKVKQIIPQIRLTDPQKLHLTIAFIGEANEVVYRPKLTEVLSKSVIGIPCFEVQPGLIDGFPTVHHPNVLWIGVNGDVDILHVIRERIKDELQELGLPIDERRYTPHISLGKLRNFKLSEMQEQKLQEIAIEEFDPIKIHDIKLFESVADHGLHQHNTLAQIPLEKCDLPRH